MQTAHIVVPCSHVLSLQCKLSTKPMLRLCFHVEHITSDPQSLFIAVAAIHEAALLSVASICAVLKHRRTIEDDMLEFLVKLRFHSTVADFSRILIDVPRGIYLQRLHQRSKFSAPNVSFQHIRELLFLQCLALLSIYLHHLILPMLMFLGPSTARYCLLRCHSSMTHSRNQGGRS
jgi:hypothetical protein